VSGCAKREKILRSFRANRLVRREIGGRGLAHWLLRKAFAHARADASRRLVDVVAVDVEVARVRAATRAIACMQRIDASTTTHLHAGAIDARRSRVRASPWTSRSHAWKKIATGC